MTGPSPVRYLCAADVAAALPPLAERLALAEQTLLALGHAAELPAKIGVHPRQPGSLAHAMPALLRGEPDDGGADLIGVKWIVGFPDNPAANLPTYHAQVILSDARNGQPLAILDGGNITAQRTAAVSGAAIRLFGRRLEGRHASVAILGAGAQARSHLPVIGHLLPGCSIRVTDLDGDRALALAEQGASIDGVGSIEVVPEVRQAVEDADVVVSVVSFGPKHQTLDPAWLTPEVLFVAVDYDMQAPAALAREAYFVVDERSQFLAARTDGGFAGYPDPAATLGDALRAGGTHPDGRILVSHLGVGLADVVFAAAILKRAEQLGLGVLLPR